MALILRSILSLQKMRAKVDIKGTRRGGITYRHDLHVDVRHRSDVVLCVSSVWYFAAVTGHEPSLRTASTRGRITYWRA